MSRSMAERWRIGGAAALCAALAALLASCQGGGAVPAATTGVARGAAPLALTRGSEGRASVVMAFDEAEAKRAVANYAVNKEREKSTYRMAGADLNGDGVAEVLVLFDGKDWCVTTGCSLAIFTRGERSYKPMFRIVRVKPPIVVGEASNNGWRHLLVMSGGGPAPMRRILLRFGGDGYPTNAMLEPEVPRMADVDGETVIDVAAPASLAKATN